MKLLLALIILASGVNAFAVEPGRGLGLYAGFGLGGNYAVLKTGNERSQFQGYTPGIEVGLDVPWGPSSGFFLAGELSRADLTNSSSSGDFIERATLVQKTGKLGLFYGYFALGGGYVLESANIKQVSTTNGNSSFDITGNAVLYFGSVNFKFKPSYRTTLEVKQIMGKVGDFNVTETVGMMKFIYTFNPD